MPARERTFLLCNGETVKYSELIRHTGTKHFRNHIIGEIVYVTMEDRKVTALAYWRISADADRVPPINPSLAVRAIIESKGIACTAVGCQRAVDWYSSRSAMEASYQRLMRHFPDGLKAMEKEKAK